MKIRNGFVSNSSSSSFVIFGTETTLEKIDFNNLKDKEKYLAFGQYMEYGREIIELTQEMIDYIKENKDCFDNMDYIKSIFYEGESWASPINLENLPKDCKMWSGETSNGGSYSVDDLKEFYVDEEAEW